MPIRRGWKSGGTGLVSAAQDYRRLCHGNELRREQGNTAICPDRSRLMGECRSG
jgi:hypothetical protein